MFTNWRVRHNPTRFSQRVLRWALAIPLTYHGVWNLSAGGAAWWASTSGLPEDLRFLVGVGELAIALSFASGVLSQLAAIALIPLMLGAVAQHADTYSFKVGGFETPLVYAMVALSIALEPSSYSLERRPEPTGY